MEKKICYVRNVTFQRIVNGWLLDVSWREEDDDFTWTETTYFKNWEELMTFIMTKLPNPEDPEEENENV